MLLLFHKYYFHRGPQNISFHNRHEVLQTDCLANYERLYGFVYLHIVEGKDMF